MKPLNLADDAPWKQRFRLESVNFSQVAHGNRSRGIVIANFSGVSQIHAWNVETGEFHQLTDNPTGVGMGSISVDGRYVYYLDEEGGSEIGHYVRVPFEGGEPQDISPELPPYASWFLGQSDSGNMLGFQAGDSEGIKMYCIKLDGDTLSAPELVYKSKAFSVGPLLSYNGEYAVIATAERSQHTEFALMALKLDAGEEAQNVKFLQEEEGGFSPIGFAPIAGDTRFLANTDVTGFERPVIWDVATGDRIDLPFVGMDGDLAAWGWSPDGKRLLLGQIVQATIQYYTYDLETSTLNKLNHPNGFLNNGYFVGDDRIFIRMQNATTPASIVVLDAQTGEQVDTLWSPADIPPSRPWRAMTFPSFDGQQVQGWVATPEGEGPFPTILHTHGGPTAVQYETFAASAQAWLDHGFAWASVNYRGSTTFGRQFEHAIFGRLGYYEVADMVAARNYLVQQGIADPDMIIPMGGSYGGYLTLMALTKKPDLWAGGIPIVGIADWTMMYEDEAETLRSYQISMFGGSPEEKPEAYANSSPLTFADDMKAPVFIIQGRNDSRCPARQMEVFIDKVQSAGKPVDVYWFEAGHGSKADDENIKQTEMMLRWAYRILG